ncbi:aldehyde-activating protein [Vibrio sp. vnigr-6D03]|uniref:GFA family protein n=1 Tax=Vibrio sp. vnigr-6D03 TaxID=2058088 RepID=UPI000C33BC4B|nr:GFA family protein [Vibrio sp. vnigr-6D03]PKF76563.1 aldehyde-activating protein [Vibrio sp. vnigr-6D03]
MSSSTQCLCGKVSLTVTSPSRKFNVCHCHSCQTWNGGPSLMVPCGEEVDIIGSEYVKEYDSSEWAVRAFCLNCGTHLYSRFKQTNQFNFPAGLFSQWEALDMAMQYFIDIKPSYYCFSNHTPTMTESEVLNHFSSAPK